MSNYLRTILIGDPHGCWDEFVELMRKLQYNQNTDRLIVLGDVMDRGPDANAILEWMRKRSIECIMGNHDDKHIRYYKHEQRKEDNRHYKNPMKFNDVSLRQFSKLSRDDINYMRSWPAYLVLDDKWVLVHGGFEGVRPLQAQFYKSVIRVRYVDERGCFVGSTNPSIQPAGTVYWTDRYYGPHNVVYGHMVHSLDQPRIAEAAAPGVMTYGLDTGCCFGGNLTAMILPSLEIVQVKAKHKYAKLINEE